MKQKGVSHAGIQQPAYKYQRLKLKPVLQKFHGPKLTLYIKISLSIFHS